MEDLHSKILDAPHRSHRSNVIHFHAVVRKIWANNWLAHLPLPGWSLPLREILDPPLLTFISFHFVIVLGHPIAHFKRSQWRCDLSFVVFDVDSLHGLVIMFSSVAADFPICHKTSH